MTNYFYSLLLPKLFPKSKALSFFLQSASFTTSSYADMPDLMKKQQWKWQKVNASEKKIDVFTGLLSDPGTEKTVLRAVAGKHNFSSFMPRPYISRCPAVWRVGTSAQEQIRFLEITQHELSKPLLAAIWLLECTCLLTNTVVLVPTSELFFIKIPQVKCN